MTDTTTPTQETQLITFTLAEVNGILDALAEAPAKYSFDLINFIRSKAQSQINAQDEEKKDKE